MTIVNTSHQPSSSGAIRYETRNWIGGVKTMPLWLTILTVLLGAIWCAWQFNLFSKGSILSDGYSYFNAWESIKGGHTDPLRTPVYAIFVGMLKEAFGKETALRIIPVAHWIMYVASMQLIWQIDRHLRIRKGLNIAVIILLMTVPGYWCFNHITMAETFSTCGMTLLVWLSVRFSDTGRRVYLGCSGCALIMLIFTKPVFIFLIPILAIFWCTGARGRKGLVLSIVLTITASGLVATYLYLVNHTHTVVSMTMATSYNKYYCLRADGLIIPDEIEDARLREQFRPMYDSIPHGWIKSQPYWQEMYRFNWPDLETMNRTAISNHPREAALGAIRRFNVSLGKSQFYSIEEDLGSSDSYDRRYAGWNGLTFNGPGGFIYPLHHLLWFPIWIGWVILLVYSGYWIRFWILRRQFPRVPFLIASTVFCAYVTVIIGAQDSWGRLMTPFNFLLPIMVSSLFSSSSLLIHSHIHTDENLE